MGEWDWAIDTIVDLEPLMTETAERIWFSSFGNVIRAYRGEDVEAEARAIYEESLAFDDPQYRGVGASSLVVSSLVNGRFDEVRRLSEEFIDQPGGVEAVPYLVRAAIWNGDLATAREARPRFTEFGAGRRQDALLATMDGGIAALDGRTDEARARFSDARRLHAEMGTLLWLGVTDLDIVITGAMEPDERRQAAEEAREIFTRLRAKALLDKLNAALTESASRTRTETPATARTEEGIGQEA